MKKGALIQITITLSTIIICIMGIAIVILASKEDTILSEDTMLKQDMIPLDDTVQQTEDLISPQLDSNDYLIDITPLPDEDFEVDTSHEDQIELPLIKPTSSYTSNYDGALISLTQEEVVELDEYLWEFGEDVAVYFYDIHSQVEYIYNPDQKFSLASMIKAPYCMFVYELASQGLVDLEQIITFEERHLSEGTGDIKEEEFGVEYTVEELIALSLQRSDNTAIEMLRDVAPLGDFIEYIKVTYKLDHFDDIKWALNTATDVKDIGAYAIGVFEFMEVNHYGEIMKNYMVNSRNKLLYLPHTVAHKYGWTLESFSDLAIVYADNPYVLVICSKRVDGTEEDYKMFSSIGNTFNNLQNKKYQEIV